MRFVLGLAILVSTIPTWADVDLEFFEAIPGFEQVLLRWETASETDCDYFLLGGDLGFSAEIAAMNSAEGAAYEYLHQGLEGWNPYAYTLFAVDINGNYQFLGEAYAMPTGDGCFIDMSAYNAIANNAEGQIELYWTTTFEWEIDHFELERVPGDSGAVFSVPATADSGQGANYQYIDNTVVLYTTYTYRLHAVCEDGTRFFMADVANEVTSRNSIELINWTNPLHDQCDTGLALPDGTVIELWQDTDTLGLDETDQIVDTGLLNGMEWGHPGGFQLIFYLPDPLPYNPNFRLRCCVPGTDRVWYSQIFTTISGTHTMLIGSQMYCVIDSNESCAQTVPEVQVNLYWDSGLALDLDLWITDPTGERCYYANSLTSTGGQLIRDNLCANYENGREEIILWPQNAPLGEYIVEADWYSSCGNQIDSQDIEVRASVQGRMIVAQLTMEEDGHVEAMRFVVDSITDAGPEPVVVTIPRDVVLHQNFPNPFNPSTTISFELPKTVHMTLTVYDVLGREVVRLYDGFMESGLHEIEWNCQNCATGVYLFELKGEGFREVKKAMLLR